MSQIPSPPNYLTTHSLTDLLDLIKEQSILDYQESVSNIHSQIQNFIQEPETNPQTATDKTKQ